MTGGAQKQAEVDSIIAACLGLNIESSTTSRRFRPAQPLPIKFEAINRSKIPVQLLDVQSPFPEKRSNWICRCQPINLSRKILRPPLPKDVIWSQPYWLRKPPDTRHVHGRRSEADRSAGESAAVPGGSRRCESAIRIFDYSVDTKYRTVDPVIGEVRQTSSSLRRSSRICPIRFLFSATTNRRSIQVRVAASTGAVHGQLRLEAPNGWRIEPASVPIELKAADAEIADLYRQRRRQMRMKERCAPSCLWTVMTTRSARERIAYPHIGLMS